MENGMSISKEKQVIVDIDSDDKCHDAPVNGETASTGNKRGKRSLEKLTSGTLNYNGSGDCEEITTTTAESFEYTSEPNLDLSVDQNLEEQQSLINKEHDKERRKAGKVKKAAKPPRPPNGPTLSAADLRLIDEFTRMAMMKKRARIERAKALKMMQASRGTPLQSTPLSSAHGITIFAMVVTVVFLLVIIFQGFVSNAGSDLSPTAPPLPAPHTLVGAPPPLQFHGAGSDDGAAPATSTAKARKGIKINRKF